MSSALTVIAPAKVNLYLHVTGRRDDGYHLLDSLVVFADIADQIALAPASRFSFSIEGPYAVAFTAEDRDSGLLSRNLAVRAAYACSRHFNHPLDCRITLVKNLPLASGLGGGSADAAAVIWGLIRFWQIKAPPLSSLMPLLLSLGADVPVCYLAQGAHVSGVGEILCPYEPMPEWPALLVNPRQICPTPAVFRAYHDRVHEFSTPTILPETLEDRGEALSFLENRRNDLQGAAIDQIPAIGAVLSAMEQTSSLRLARMSGSGATVFGLYENDESAYGAAEQMQSRFPNWWVRPCRLNSVVRY
ncbi:MAG: 4-(cytidine 5'-diphospho)-2-C-methyl-D-erythritol kinase [Micavibrio aeruginosavorus]|uniref:4-diphosphocytidyl-2-C-methyl-D-erythritol kinase n=1 Tax=Micavibrio aeruginosavorus TaxID=349221 RepID=A0A7T5R1Q6_9BACT|nr:MAG: 4-(cytidine 5'-diphospho)-2-C-methyl-D-erythritol kinase [Micavibrio aeruginosavorus]